MYSNLASFTFGAAPPSRPDMIEMVNPLTSASGSISRDRTPRPSVSGPSSGSSQSSPYTSLRDRTYRMQDRGVAESGDSADDEDDEEAIRQSRAKMRAMNDGSRRPSLPVNTYRAGRSSSPAIPPASKASPRRSTGDIHEDDRDVIRGNHDVAVHTGTSYGDGDHGDGDFDTDVELDIPHHYGSRTSLVSDTVSQHIFGDSRHFGDGAGDDSDDRMIVVEEDCDTFDHDLVPGIRASKLTLEDGAYTSARVTSPSHSRRGSVSWKIPGTSASEFTARDREDSVVTLPGRHFNRSLDEGLSTPEYMASTTGCPSGGFEANNVESNLQPEDLTDYSTGGTASAYDGLDINYILGSSHMDDVGIRQSWSSGAPSYIQAREDGANQQRRTGLTLEFPPWGFPNASGRRPSAITVSSASGEDAFTRAVDRKWDPLYSSRRNDWSFRQENADGNGPALSVSPPSFSGFAIGVPTSVMPGTQEIWRQAHVGRFRVDRLMMRPDDPSKPPQQRMNVRHITDQDSKGNTRGGPTSVIHKHSRALAFSIFRKYGLLKRGTRSTSHNSGSILLATKRVQEQYTSTRTTSQLNSHGLLRDGDDVEREREETSESHPLHDHGRSKDQKDNKDKGKKSASGTSSGTGTSSQTTSTESSSTGTTSSEEPRSVTYGVYEPSSSSVPISPTIVENLPASGALNSSSSSVSDSTLTTRDLIDYPLPLHEFPSSRLYYQHSSADDDDELMLPRTSHAEAFATLDSSGIEYLRGRAEQRLADHDSSSISSLERWRRRFLGQNARVALRATSGPPSASLDGHYTPPWITMAPRSKQEERERVIQNLNESFKDVGLLPSFRTNRNPRGKSSRRRKTGSGLDIFANVPAHSLHMLLPLWAGETDPTSTSVDEVPAAVYTIPVEERQYLLVYYVPFDERKDKKKPEPNKKRSRGETSSGGDSSNPTNSSKSILLTSFRVCARLISYHDLLGTGVRLPIDGLSVTGPMSEAMSLLPPSYIREAHLDDIVIGVCSSRQTGMEFIQEGLAKLGLCVPCDEPAPSPIDPTQEIEELWKLTPIGRAAVEMAWLGCLAMTSFGSELQAH
ncbi:hypothetical protein BKA93DRAFT_818692 [Sparassis latifolia]